MARFTKAQKNAYRASQYASGWASGQSKTIEQMRDVCVATENEIDRHRPDESVCSGVLFLEGSDPDKQFDMELLDEGEAGTIVLDGVNTGYQLIPIFTGSGINQTTTPAGVVIPSTPFDGTSEVIQGETAATENMLKVQYSGYWSVVASCKPAPQGAQANREIETDLFVFDSSGNALRSIGFVASANQSTGGRAFTQNIPRSTLAPTFLAEGEYLGLVIRKFLGEPQTDVRLSKAFIQIDLVSFGD